MMKLLGVFLLRAFSDANGRASSTRILSALVMCNVLSVRSYVCIKSNTFVPLGYDNMLLIASCLGMKIYQRKIEGEGDDERKVASN